MTVISVHQHTSAARRPLPAQPAADAGDAAPLQPDDDALCARRAAPGSAAGLGRSPARWAQAAMTWHQPQLTEFEVLQAVVDSVAVLVPGSVGAAVLSGPEAGGPDPGRVRVQAIAGILPGFARAVRQDASLSVQIPAQPGTAGVGRTCNGWPIATTPARSGEHVALIWVPLGQGVTMCGTLLIAGVQVADRMEADAVVTAMHASTAIAAARQRQHLRLAADSRDIVGQAKGIVMERFRLTAPEAFAMLCRASQDTNVKLRDLCAGVCASGDLGMLRRQPPSR